jgi:hypothetical protein
MKCVLPLQMIERLRLKENNKHKKKPLRRGAFFLYLFDKSV